MSSSTKKLQLSHFFDKRLLSIFILGIASGFPWVMIGSGLSAWLQEQSISRSAIGLLGVSFAVYSFNFLWSPLLDRLPIPLLTRMFGQRKSWLLLTQLGICAGCLTLSTLHGTESLWVIGLFAFSIAVCSATQDIAIDGYRIDIIHHTEKESISAGAAMATAGWWTGFAGLGSIPFYLADLDGWQWNQVYQILALIMLALLMFSFTLNEPNIDRRAKQEQIAHQLLANSNLQLEGVKRWFYVLLVAPLQEFFNRNGARLALSILAFIFLFKIGEAFLGKMSIVFYKEIGFSNTDIATYSKVVTWWTTIVFAVIGSVVNIRFGIIKGLFIGGIAMSASNLHFAVIALNGPDPSLLVIAVLVDGFTSAWSSVAFVSFLSVMCNHAFSASQYAILASLSTAGRTVLASLSGVLVDALDGRWDIFFIITALMIIPSLVLLFHLKDALRQFDGR